MWCIISEYLESCFGHIVSLVCCAQKEKKISGTVNVTCFRLYIDCYYLIYFLLQCHMTTLQHTNSKCLISIVKVVCTKIICACLFHYRYKVTRYYYVLQLVKYSNSTINMHHRTAQPHVGSIIEQYNHPHVGNIIEQYNHPHVGNIIEQYNPHVGNIIEQYNPHVGKIIEQYNPHVGNIIEQHNPHGSHTTEQYNPHVGNIKMTSYMYKIINLFAHWSFEEQLTWAAIGLCTPSCPTPLRLFDEIEHDKIYTSTFWNTYQYRYPLKT